MIRTGLFGGTFNPVHCGHLRLAQWLVEKRVVDEVWLTLSPLNPLKSVAEGASDADRRAMLSLACREREGIEPCFAEFELPRPSYTVDTLRYLSEKHPERAFVPVIGADNWLLFEQWRQWRTILSDYGVIVYPRPGYDIDSASTPGMTYVADAPVTDISSTQIRKNPAHSGAAMLPEAVLDYIRQNKLYEIKTQ